MTPAISVIIPVYNTREYLPFTLRNVIEDQFSTMSADEWELIVVDDGSTDGSHLEVEPWIERYPGSVKLIRKPNAGVSAARNDGLTLAKGRYVYFLDSDDILLRGTLPVLVQLADQTNADIVKFLFRAIDEREYKEFSSNVPECNINASSVHALSVVDYMEKTNAMSSPMIQTSTWQSIYDRKLLVDNSIKYDPSLRTGEDELFGWCAINKASNICYVEESLILYNQRRGSASHAVSEKDVERFNSNRYLMFGKLYHAIYQSRKIMSADLFDNVMKYHKEMIQQKFLDLLRDKAPLGRILKYLTNYARGGGLVYSGFPHFAPLCSPHGLGASVRLHRMIVAYVYSPILAYLQTHKT